MHIIAHQQGKIFKKISSCCYKKKITGKLKKKKQQQRTNILALTI